MRHELKLKDVFWESVMNGDKSFEVRLNDRFYQRGDTVEFVCVDAKGPVFYSGEYEITYVLMGFGLQPNYVAFGIKRKPTHTANEGKE